MTKSMAANFKSTMLFDVLKNILTTKSMNLYRKHISSVNFKDAAPFMVRRYLTMHTNSVIRDIMLDNFAALERMDERTLYLWLLEKIPKVNNSFIRYLR